LILLFFGEHSRNGFEIGDVPLVEFRDQRRPFPGEGDDPYAPVIGRGLSRDKRLLLQAIDSGGHRGVCQKHVLPDVGDRHRTLVQQNLKNHEVAETETLGRNALLDVAGHSPLRAGEDDPELRSGCS